MVTSLRPGGDYFERPQVALLSKMTAVHRNARHHVIGELAQIGAATRTFIDDRKLDWGTFFSHEHVLAWREGRPRSPRDIVQINDSALNQSDAVIAHGHDDGSTSLGMLLRSALESDRCPPVLVIAHDDEKMSKYLLGLEREHQPGSSGIYRNLRVERFGDEATMWGKVMSWLEENQSMVQRRWRDRVAAAEIWGPTATQIRLALAKAEESVLADLFLNLPITRDELERRLEARSPMADMSVGMFSKLTSTLRIDVAEIDLLQQCRRWLRPGELAAWQAWARTVNRAFAKHVLAAVLDDRARPGISLEFKELRQTGAWVDRAERWMRDDRN